jgi:hypothetical protein
LQQAGAGVGGRDKPRHKRWTIGSFKNADCGGVRRRWGMAGPDIKNIEALPAPSPGKETATPQPDTKNLDALLDSLNGSAERFQTLWFSFLGLTLYLAIAAQATSHRALLLEEGQTLPILSIKVGLLPFLCYHARALPHLSLLFVANAAPPRPDRSAVRERIAKSFA